MTTFKPGAVVLIPFPFTDLSTSKKRPCVVISSEDFNESNADVIVAAITSRVPDQPGSDHYVFDDGQLKAAGLPKRSMVKLGKIITIDTRLIRKQLGHLPDGSLDDIISRIHTIIHAS